MDKFTCERCDSRLFVVARERGMLQLKCIKCGEEYYTTVPANLYPWPAPGEGE